MPITNIRLPCYTTLLDLGEQDSGVAFTNVSSMFRHSLNEDLSLSAGVVVCLCKELALHTRLVQDPEPDARHRIL
jgi:hypothetical protein